MKTDKLFHRIFEACPEILCRLAGLDEATGYTQRSLELKEVGTRLDGLLWPADETAPFLFWEAQFYRDDEFYYRWLSGLVLTLRQQKIRHWRALVLYPDPSYDRGDIAPFAPLFESGWIQRIYLEDLEHAESGDWGSDLLRLVVAAPGASAPIVARIARQGVEGCSTDADRRQMIGLLETVLIYKFPRLGREEIRKMLHLPDVDLKDTRFYQEVFAEGKAEGKTEGKAEGEALIIWRQLNRRIANLPISYRNRISGLSSEKLESLADALFDFRSEQDLADWLD